MSSPSVSRAFSSTIQLPQYVFFTPKVAVAATNTAANAQKAYQCSEGSNGISTVESGESQLSTKTSDVIAAEQKLAINEKEKASENTSIEQESNEMVGSMNDTQDTAAIILESMRTTKSRLDFPTKDIPKVPHSVLAIKRSDGSQVSIIDMENVPDVTDTENGSLQDISPDTCHREMSMKDILEDIRLETSRVQAKLSKIPGSEASKLLDTLNERVSCYIRECDEHNNKVAAYFPLPPPTKYTSSDHSSDSESAELSPETPSTDIETNLCVNQQYGPPYALPVAYNQLGILTAPCSCSVCTSVQQGSKYTAHGYYPMNTFNINKCMSAQPNQLTPAEQALAGSQALANQKEVGISVNAEQWGGGAFPTPNLPHRVRGSAFTDKNLEYTSNPPLPVMPLSVKSEVVTNAAHPSKKRLRRSVAENVQCQQCGTSSTPEWRRGPDGLRTLCNACGLYHAKIARKKGEAEAMRLLRKRRVN